MKTLMEKQRTNAAEVDGDRKGFVVPRQSPLSFPTKRNGCKDKFCKHHFLFFVAVCLQANKLFKI